jgi:copper(I)-binding protein
MKTFFLVLLALISVSACDRDTGAPLQISDTVVYAPLPGTSAAVAYMTLTNNTRAEIFIASISSPQFDSVMLHETRIVDGVARMAMLGSLLIPAQSSIRLQQGGKHIMLMQANQGAEPGQSVTLRIHFDVGGLLIIDATLQSRMGREADD